VVSPSTPAELDNACLTAHGGSGDGRGDRRLVTVFAGDVAVELLLMGARLGYAIALVDPEPTRLDDVSARFPGLTVASAVADLELLDDTTDVVVTDHHRVELGQLLRDVLAHGTARWVGVIGSPRHEGPHLAALRALEVDEAAIARVHRPIGLNIGSRTPPEIAVSTLAGLLADRAGRPGGFSFS